MLRMLEIMNIIAAKKVYPVYQPIVDLVDGKIIGYEALSRGPNNISPELLFEAANQYGLTRILDTLCLQKCVEHINGKELIFLNILPYTLVWLTINGEINRLIGKNIVFELLETEKISEPNEFVQIIRDLRKKEFKFAIDDISYGFSRLHIIPLIKPEYIKIDRGLVTDEDKAYGAMIKNLVNISREMNTKLIVEKVENEIQCKNIFFCGVRYYQGYYFAKPGEKAIIPDISRFFEDDFSF